MGILVISEHRNFKTSWCYLFLIQWRKELQVQLEEEEKERQKELEEKQKAEEKAEIEREEGRKQKLGNKYKGPAYTKIN